MTTLLTPLTRPYDWSRSDAAVAEFRAAQTAASKPFGIWRASFVSPKSAMADARAAGAPLGSAIIHTVKAVTLSAHRAIDAYGNVAGHAVTYSDDMLRQDSAGGMGTILRTTFMPWTRWNKAWQPAWQGLVEQAAVNLVVTARPTAEAMAAHEPAIARVLGLVGAGAGAALATDQSSASH